jgi:hypothetical protein
LSTEVNPSGRRGTGSLQDRIEQVLWSKPLGTAGYSGFRPGVGEPLSVSIIIGRNGTDSPEGKTGTAEPTPTSPRVGVVEVAKRFKEYLLDAADRDGARKCNEKIRLYCKIERITYESLARVITEMGRNGSTEKGQHGCLDSVGRALAATASDDASQRWRDFFRVLIHGGKSKGANGRADAVITGLDRKTMALSLEWMLDSEVGSGIAIAARAAMRDTINPAGRCSRYCTGC